MQSRVAGCTLTVHAPAYGAGAEVWMNYLLIGRGEISCDGPLSTPRPRIAPPWGASVPHKGQTGRTAASE
jgi:hypothetical protein